MENSTLQFYKQLAGDYHLIFPDWKKAVLKHGEFLDNLIRSHMDASPLSVLDCTCGIGTQAIGLALRGYEVHATDLSPEAVEHAAKNAGDFGASIAFGTADLRTLDTQVDGLFDIVISCDNALPHLLNDEELLLAARNIRSKLRQDGLFMASIRDYDQILEEKPRSTMPSVFDDPEGRRVVFQIWDWSDDGRTYTTQLFIVKKVKDDWRVAQYQTEYRALLRDELNAILQKSGFSEIRWHMPDGSWNTLTPTGYYQPIVTAHKR